MNTLNETIYSSDTSIPPGVLDPSTVAERWKEVGDSLVRLMAWMDNQEAWLSQEGDSELIGMLSHLISLSEHESWVREMHKPHIASALAELLAWVASSRFFRVLEVMDRNSPNFVNRLALALGRVGGESSRFADLFFERVMVVHRGELLGQVFGSKRAAGIADTVRAIRDTRNVEV